MNNPGKIDFNKTYDKFSEAKKGMYASTLAVYDIVTKEYTARTYDYLAHFNALYDRDNTVQPMISLSGNDRLNEKSNSLIHNKPSHLGLFGNANFLLVDNSKHLSPKQADAKFKMLINKGIDKFLKKPIKSKIGKAWLRREKKHQKVFKDPGQSKLFQR